MSSTPWKAERDYMQRLRILGLSEDQAYAYVEQMINGQSYTLATDHR